MLEAMQTTRRHGRLQFKLSSLLFVTFATALCLALFRASTVLGVIFIPLAAIALVRTMRAVAASVVVQRQGSHVLALYGVSDGIKSVDARWTAAGLKRIIVFDGNRHRKNAADNKRGPDNGEYWAANDLE